ncbi:MAG TPA: RNA 2',3'-cyclic phosphodiesterase [Lacunisphaera sp.]|nr:RNA 2',3'-cyclic phosphodiesterase [Lacunisphaera sp.]
MTRLFTALMPPATVRSELAALAAPLEGVRWTPADDLHLTMRFIGDTDEDKAERFAESLARVRVEPFVLPVGGVGIFPSRGPAKVLWAGVGHGHTRLYQLRKQVDEALLAVDTGLAVPGFHPHFTIARLDEDCDAKQLAQFLARYKAFEAPPFRVAEFHLVASQRQGDRPPAYRVVQAFPLHR